MFYKQISILIVVIVCCSLNVIDGSNTADIPLPSNIEQILGKNCDTGYSMTCLKLDIVTFIEKNTENKEYLLLPGISLVQDITTNGLKTPEIVAEIARTFPNDADKRLDGFLIAKIGNLLQSLSLKWTLLDPTSVEDARSTFTGRRGTRLGKRGGLEAIMAAGMMMKGTLMSIAMGALALLAGKALLTGLMALMLSSIVGLKGLTSGGGKSTTYEIVAKPVYQSTHSHSVSHEDLHGGGGGGGGAGGGHTHSGYGSYARSLNFELPEHLTKPIDN